MSPPSESVQEYSFDATNISISNTFSDQSETCGSGGDSAFSYEQYNCVISDEFLFLSLSRRFDLVDQNPERISVLAETEVTRALESMGDCVEDTAKENDRKQQLLFDPRVVQGLVNTDDRDLLKTDYDIETVLDSPSIMVLVSKRNARSGKICDPSHFSHIVFYMDSYVSLEKFLRDLFIQV